MAPHGQTSQQVRFASVAGAPCDLDIQAHDPSSGLLQSIGTQVACDITYTYEIENQGPTVAVVLLCQPTSYQAVEILSPSGAQIGFATFTLPPMMATVQPFTSDPPVSIPLQGLVHVMQSISGGPFPEFEGAPGTQLKLQVHFPAVLNTQSGGQVRIKETIDVQGTVTVTFA
jgi:hypothetical protein